MLPQPNEFLQEKQKKCNDSELLLTCNPVVTLNRSACKLQPLWLLHLGQV